MNENIIIDEKVKLNLIELNLIKQSINEREQKIKERKNKWIKEREIKNEEMRNNEIKRKNEEIRNNEIKNNENKRKNKITNNEIERKKMLKIINENIIIEKKIERKRKLKEKDDEWAKENDYESINEFFLKRDIQLNKGKQRYKKNKNIPDYKRGVLDLFTTVGFGFLAQRIVAKTLELELKDDCNCELGFGAPYDLYDKLEYDKINVKASTLNNDNTWNFSFRNKFIPDTYINVGFSLNKKDILHVWIINHNSDIINDKTNICITNSYKNLKKYEQYEVDVRPYNYVYHNMSLENCKVLKLNYNMKENKKYELDDFNKCKKLVSDNLKMFEELLDDCVIKADLDEFGLKNTSLYTCVINLNGIFKDYNYNLKAEYLDNNIIIYNKDIL